MGDQRRVNRAEEDETILARTCETPDSILLIDPQGMVLACNEPALKWFDRSAEEIVGRNMFQLLPDSLTEPWRERVDQVIHSGQPVRWEEERQGLTIENSVYPLCDEHGAVSRLFLIGRDITERKREEEELQKLASVIHSSNELVNLSTLDGKMIFLNEAGSRMLGISPAELQQTNIMQVIPDPFKEKVETELMPALTNTGSWAGDLQYLNLKTGQLTDVHATTFVIKDPATGAPLYLANVSFDIKRRKQAEQALQESERKFRDAIKNLDEGYYRCTPDGLLLEHNVAFNRILGLHLDENLKGEKLPDFWQNPEDRKQYLHELNTRGFVRNFPINAKKIDGAQIVVMASAHLVTDEKDQTTSIEGTFTDFTEQKRLEEELIQAKDSLERRVSERTRELQEAISYNRNLIEASVDPLVTIGPEGKVTDVNRATETITGRTRQELIGTDFSDYFTDPEKARAGYRQAFAEGLVRDYELLLRHADGHATPVRYNATVYRDSLGQVVGVFAAARDVTEWKNTEETLVKNKQILDETGRLARVGGWEIDLKKNELSWSDVVYQIHEIDPPYQPTVDAGINFYAPEAIPVISEAVRRAIEEGEPFDVELQLITAKGNRLWVRAIGQAYRTNGEIVKIGGVFHDINDRKLAENELMRHRDHLEELVAERTTELTRSRELLLEAETVARMGSWEWDVVGDEIAGSAEFFLLFDVRPEQLAHLPQFMGLLHADDRERVQRDLADALEQRKMYDTDYRVILSDGEWRHINARGRMYFDETDRPLRMVGTCLDITERKQAEEAAQESAIRYNTLFNNSTDGILIADLETAAFKYANPALCRMFGYTEDELRTMGLPDIHPKETLQSVFAEFEALARGDKTLAPGIPCLRKDGSVFHADVGAVKITVDGRPCNVGFFRDITERKQTEQALRLSDAAVASAKSPIALSDLTGTLTKVNRAFLEAWGYSDPAEMLGHPAAEFWQAGDQAAEVFAQIQKTGAWEGELGVLRKDGTPFLVQVSASTITDAEGQTTGMMASFLDITERKRLEQELARKAEDLARSNAELEQFAYVASHDLQEPLRMISSYVQLLARHNQGKLDSDSQEFIAFAADGATRMQALIQDLLAFSRVGTWGKPFVPTDCDVVLERALNHLKVAIEESGARITFDSLPMLRADDNQLVQLFQNLVGNALKFHQPEIPPTIHIGAKRSGPDWVFAVRDNGIGIPAEQSKRVFEIFQRLHGSSEYPGTGIGLAVCRKIVERHGGRIWVESAVGEGSTFTFTLPQGDDNRTPNPDQSFK